MTILTHAFINAASITTVSVSLDVDACRLVATST